MKPFKKYLVVSSGKNINEDIRIFVQHCMNIQQKKVFQNHVCANCQSV